MLKDFTLSLDVPSECARKLIDHEADIGLIPVGALPCIHKYDFVSNHCIGAISDVKSVLLLSDSELSSIKTIYLDTDSRTSVNLVRVLAEKFWHIAPGWKCITELHGNLATDEAKVLIGDKTFGLSTQFNYCYDLAAEWIKFTSLPFVFAVWVTNTFIPEEFKLQLEKALSWGVSHRSECSIVGINLKISENELVEYLQNNISFELDDDKKKGLNLFLSYLKELKLD